MKNTKKLKICFIPPNNFPVPAVRGGAVETLVQFLLDENEKHGFFDFTCVSIEDSQAIIESQKYKNTKFIVIKENLFKFIPIKNKKNFLGKVLRFLKIQYELYVEMVYSKIKNQNFDYIFIEGGNLLKYASLKKKMPNTKFIGCLHGPIVGSDEYSFFDYFFACSKYIQNKFLEKNTFEFNRVKLHYNAISIPAFSKKIDENKKQELKETLKINKTDKVIVFIGRLISEKGVKELLMAFKKMRNNQNCKLVIIGNSNFGYNAKTAYEKELINSIEAIKEKVIFTGFVHNTEIYKYFQIAHIAVFPTMYEEAFGMVIIETMCSGLPLIVTDSGALPEITNEENRIMVKRDENMIRNLSDKMDFLIENEKLRLKMGKEGIKWAKQFSSENYFKNFVKNVQEIEKQGEYR